jgi:sugar/nucleoside kinase (ribokinase family)
VIVVVGSLAWRAAEPAGPAGRTCGIALAAAARGATVEVVGRAGDDPAGDALVIDLARAGVGHAAVLRDPARPTPVVTEILADEAAEPFADEDAPTAVAVPPGPRLEPADVALGLAYLTSFGVLVVADDAPPDVIPVCIERAAFAGAHLVILVPDGTPPPDDLPATAMVLAAPADGGSGAIGRTIGDYAAHVDAGMEPGRAFRLALDGWDAPVSDGTAS